MIGPSHEPTHALAAELAERTAAAEWALAHGLEASTMLMQRAAALVEVRLRERRPARGSYREPFEVGGAQ